MHRVKVRHASVRGAAISFRLSSPVLLLLALGMPVPIAAAQETTLDGQDRSRGHRMLGVLREELEDRYYDATFHGIDLDTLYAKADSAISRATSYTEMLGVLAQFLLVLNDSHTLFDPPPLRVRAEYGISWQPVGDECYVTAVDSNSDAHRKGVRPGDRLLRINQMPVTRRSAPLLSYVYYLLRPSRALVLDLVRDGQVETTEIAAEITRRPPVLNLQDQATRIRVREEWETDIPVHTTVSFGDSVLVWRMPEFIYADRYLDEIMNRARDYSVLVMDLRGNPGGSERAMISLLGRFFDERLVLATRRSRNKEEEVRVRPRGGRPYEGRVIVLIDSYSASGAEITARTLQREGKAIVVGDRSGGAVMEATYRPHRAGGATRYAPYGIMITIAELVLPGGERLEGVGVTPDSLVLPTGTDLLEKRDPQMALALRLAGLEVTAEEAGKIYEER